MKRRKKKKIENTAYKYTIFFLLFLNLSSLAFYIFALIHLCVIRGARKMKSILVVVVVVVVRMNENMRASTLVMSAAMNLCNAKNGVHIFCRNSIESIYNTYIFGREREKGRKIHIIYKYLVQ